MQQHKSDFIDWKAHPTLNGVTKLGIQYMENAYTFEAYLDDRSKKDNKFVDLLKADEEGGKRVKDEDGSEFSVSGEEDEEMSNNNADDHWDRNMAERFYKGTREEIEHKYTVE
jgi:hypothetical protein